MSLPVEKMFTVPDRAISSIVCSATRMPARRCRDTRSEVWISGPYCRVRSLPSTSMLIGSAYSEIVRALKAGDGYLIVR